MEAITPYLNFNGNAAEALDFYAKAFGGTVVFKQAFRDGPMDVSDRWKDKILHASFQSGDLTFMVSDTMEDGPKVTSGSNTSLSLNFREVSRIDEVFTTLSEDAHITMPLQDTFWGARFGMLTDKFGINWMFNHDYEKKES